MSIFSSITGIAKAATGDTSQFRKVLGLQPGLIPFKFPPQVDKGIQVLKAVGVKVPTISEVQSSLDKEVDVLLKEVARPVKDVLNDGTLKEVESILSRVEWLL